MNDKLYRMPILSAQVISDLRLHYSQVPHVQASSHRRRMGENGPLAPSVYTFSRWYTWTKAKRDDFKALWREDIIKDAMVGWHLAFPPVIGFLDRMTTWVGEIRTGSVVSYNIGGDCTILIDDRPVVVKHGEGIAFNLRMIHEIKASKAGQQWACIMTLHNPAKYGGEEVVL